MQLAQKHCVPCQKGDAPIEPDEARTRVAGLSGWTVATDGKWLEKQFKFKNFLQALDFTTRIGTVAEEEQHHPDLTLGWGYVGVRLQTHVVGGLHENDFILAAKIEAIQPFA